MVVLDLRKAANFCDYFVILSSTSTRRAKAIADTIIEDLKKIKIRPLSRSPREESGWLLLDFSSVILHIFHSPVREFYALEHLWQDAKHVRIPRARKK